LIGEPQRPSSAVQQARPETFFQAAHGLADRRWRHAKGLRGRNEAASFHYPHEYDDIAVIVQCSDTLQTTVIIRPYSRQAVACLLEALVSAPIMRLKRGKSPNASMFVDGDSMPGIRDRNA
jgi:hypothetical protein